MHCMHCMHLAANARPYQDSPGGRRFWKGAEASNPSVDHMARSLPGPQVRGTAGTLILIWIDHRDRGRPPPLSTLPEMAVKPGFPGNCVGSLLISISFHPYSKCIPRAPSILPEPTGPNLGHPSIEITNTEQLKSQ